MTTKLDDAWNGYLRELASSVESRWNAAALSYRALREVRENLGLPFYSEALGMNENPNAVSNGWSPVLDQQAADLQEMNKIIISALRDAANGDREVAIQQGGEFWIARKQTDSLVVRDSQNGEVPILAKPDGTPVQASGTIGVAWGVAAIAVVGVVVASAQVFAVIRATETLESLAEQKTMQTLAEKQAEIIVSGKATPEQAQKMTDSIYKGAATLEIEKKKAPAGAPIADPDKWSGLVKTIGWVAALLLAGYIVIKLLPEPSRSRAEA